MEIEIFSPILNTFWNRLQQVVDLIQSRTKWEKNFDSYFQ